MIFLVRVRSKIVFTTERGLSDRYRCEDVVAWNEYSCSYEGEGLVGGKRVRNPHRRWTGMLPDCDAHTFGMSDEVMRDVKLMAYHRAGGPDELLDGPESMHCNALALPIQ